MTLPVYVQKQDNRCWLIHLWVQPGAAKTGWAGLHGDRLKVRLNAPPVDGKANSELIRFLSKNLHLSPSHIMITAGLHSRGKTVRITEVQDKDLLARLPEIMSPSPRSEP